MSDKDKRKDIMDFIGKEVIIFYNDTQDHVIGTIGLLTSVSDNEYILGDNILIPKNKVVRIKIKEEEKDGEKRA